MGADKPKLNKLKGFQEIKFLKTAKNPLHSNGANDSFGESLIRQR
jgi:hypothetical protein